MTTNRIIIKEVECCDNCLFSEATDGGFYYFCSHPDNEPNEDGTAPEIEDGETFPEWCPLPEKKNVSVIHLSEEGARP